MIEHAHSIGSGGQHAAIIFDGYSYWADRRLYDVHIDLRFLSLTQKAEYNGRYNSQFPAFQPTNRIAH